MQPLILGAALIKVLAAADVHALVVDADLEEVVPVDGKSPPAMASMYRGYSNGYCDDLQHMARARNLGKASI